MGKQYRVRMQFLPDWPERAAREIRAAGPEWEDLAFHLSGMDDAERQAWGAKRLELVFAEFGPRVPLSSGTGFGLAVALAYCPREQLEEILDRLAADEDDEAADDDPDLDEDID